MDDNWTTLFSWTESAKTLATVEPAQVTAPAAIHAEIPPLREKEVEEQPKALERIAADILDSRELFLWKSFVNSLLRKKLGSNANHPYPHHASTN